MRIVNICLNGPYTEGFTYQDNLLPKWQSRNGNDVTVIAPTTAYGEDGVVGRVPECDYVDADGVRVIRIDNDQGKPCTYRFKTYSKLVPLLELIGPDVVFQHGPQMRDTRSVCGYVRAHAETRLFVDNHADDSNSAVGWVSKWLLHRIFWRHYVRMLLPLAERFWGVTPARVDFMVENYGVPRDRCGLLVMGADDDDVSRAKAPGVREVTRARLGVGEGELLVVTGGKIDPAKRQTVNLIRAVSGLDGVRLLVFGSIADVLRAEFDDAISESPNSSYSGWASAAKASAYFEAADLVCFPGRHSVFWEQAAGQGKPMLLRRWEGYGHVDCGGNVAYTSGDDVVSLRGDLKGLLMTGRLAEMGRVAGACADEFLYSGIARRSIDG